MSDNPEFRRNAWLELTPHRLIATPVVLVLLLTLILSRQEVAWRDSVAMAAVVIFALVTALWGGRQTYDAVVDEVRERTWDTQRMSALTPWEMTLGKLLGSTIFNWYVGAYCLVAFVVSFDATSAWPLGGWSVIEASLLLILSASFIHASGLLSGLTSVRSGRTIKPSRNLPLTLLGIVVFLGMTRALLQHAVGVVVWYGIVWQGKVFILLSLAVFTGWVWLGAYRLMSEILAVRSIPWAALAFVIFLTVYACGFVDDSAWSYSSRFAAIGSMIGGTVVYIEAWKERRDWIAVQRFIRAWRQESLQQALEATPNWLVIAGFTLAVSLMSSLLPANHPYIPGLSSKVTELLTLSPTVLTLLMFRDIGLLYFFSLGDRPERASSTTLIYLTMLYIVLPTLFNLGGFGFLAFPGLFPVEQGASWLGVIVAIGHLAVVAQLLKQRLRQPDHPI